MAAAAQQAQMLMYAVASPDSIADFQAHARQTGIIAPQVLTVDAEGGVRGAVPQAIAGVAAQDHVRLMPLVINAGFNMQVMDRLLHSRAAEQRMIGALAREGVAGHWWGIQFDFEHIPASDRDLYSRLVADAGEAFHRQGLKFSVTVVPRISSDPQAFSAGGWEEWSGVYDYRALGAHTDFVTVMTYAEHSGLTAPGPISGMPWIRACVDYALGFIPADKISIGAAFYSNQWVGPPGQPIPPVPLIPPVYAPLHPSPWKSHGGSSAWASALWRRFPGRWDEQQQAFVTARRSSASTQVIWWSRARSLGALLRLVRERHLAGISAWRLGQEDPAVWRRLP